MEQSEPAAAANATWPSATNAFATWWDMAMQCNDNYCLASFLGWIIVYIWLVIAILCSVFVLMALIGQGLVCLSVALASLCEKEQRQSKKKSCSKPLMRTLPPSGA